LTGEETFFKLNEKLASKLKACSEEEREKCARLLIVNVLNFPKRAYVYAMILREIVHKTAIPSNAAQKKLFEHIEDQLYDEVEEISQTKRFDSFRVTKIGVFLGECFEIDIIKTQFMVDYLNNVALHLPQQEQARHAFLKIFKVIKETLKIKSRHSYVIFNDMIKNNYNIETADKKPAPAPTTLKTAADSFAKRVET